MIAVGSRWRERTGREFVVRDVLPNGAVSVMFDGGWPLTLAATEVAKWTLVGAGALVAAALELAVAA